MRFLELSFEKDRKLDTINYLLEKSCVPSAGHSSGSHLNICLPDLH